MVKSNKFFINLIECSSIEENSSDKYILEVDLECLDALHQLHNDYPLVLENLEVSHKIPSNCCSNIANKYGIKIGHVKTLVPNLGNKSKYVFHYKNLQLFLPLGMKLTKVHRISKFKTSDWLKKYIDFNTDKRKHGRGVARI